MSSVVDSIQYIFGKNYWNELLFKKKYQDQIDSVNSMYDHELPKVNFKGLEKWKKSYLLSEYSSKRPM